MALNLAATSHPDWYEFSYTNRESNMELVQIRRWFTDRSTISEMFADPIDEASRGFQCYILEDKYRGDDITKKVKGMTAIPCGRYRVAIDYSERFKTDMPHVLNVPGFVGIRIHPGNTSVDTEGCLLPGQKRGVDIVEFSRPAYAELCQKLRQALGRGEEVWLTIKLSPDAVPLQ